MVNSQNYAVAVILETPEGFPLISDPHKPLPHYWKFPGGRSQPGETPLTTAIRELKEETGVSVPPREMKLVHEETRAASGAGHGFFVFHARRRHAVKLLERGAGGETVKFFTRDQLKTLPDLFPNHRALAEATIFKKKLESRN